VALAEPKQVARHQGNERATALLFHHHGTGALVIGQQLFECGSDKRHRDCRRGKVAEADLGELRFHRRSVAAQARVKKDKRQHQDHQSRRRDHPTTAPIAIRIALIAQRLQRNDNTGGTAPR